MAAGFFLIELQINLILRRLMSFSSVYNFIFYFKYRNYFREFTLNIFIFFLTA